MDTQALRSFLELALWATPLIGFYVWRYLRQPKPRPIWLSEAARPDRPKDEKSGKEVVRELFHLYSGMTSLLFHASLPFLRAFVIQNLWNWFAAEALHTASISYWQALGFTMLVYMAHSPHLRQQEEKQDRRWEWALAILEEYVPEENKPSVAEVIAEAKDETKPELISAIGNAATTTTILAAGWAVHTFLM